LALCESKGRQPGPTGEHSPRPPQQASTGNSYAPPISGAELRSARMGTTLGRPVNAVVVSFFAWFFFFLFFWFSGFTIFFCFSFSFLFCSFISLKF
jgi:hypothetical protein